MIIILLLFVLTIINTSHGSKLNFINKFIQCPYDESACYNDINCDSSSMGRRAGYFCNKWPFYSGGFAECCDTDEEFFTCTHAVYNYETNNVFCDFWYETHEQGANDLQLCDCKVNNDEYCTSWICTTITGYDFNADMETHSDLIKKLLLPNEIEIFGVHQCGYFTDHILTQNEVLIPQYCYKYDDFKSCYCLPEEEDSEYCQNWICHQYLNNKKHDIDIDLDADWSDPEYQKTILNISDPDELEKYTANYTSATIDILNKSTVVSYEEYECVTHYDGRSDTGDPVDKTECTQWAGSLRFADDRFSVRDCAVQTWNEDLTTFRDFDPETKSMNTEVHLDTDRTNVTLEDLYASYSDKWYCKESGMDYRQNTQFTNFYLSTLIWSIGVGFILLFLIRCYMRYKYITLSSFFCVQGWFFFIFGSIAAVHGGFVSFAIYFCLQFIILGHIICIKCKNRGKQPYGSVQRYDFDPIDEDSQLGIKNNKDDDNL